MPQPGSKEEALEREYEQIREAYRKALESTLQKQIEAAEKQQKERAERPSVQAKGYVTRIEIDAVRSRLLYGLNPCRELSLKQNEPYYGPMENISVDGKDHERATFAIVALTAVNTGPRNEPDSKAGIKIKLLGKPGDNAGHLVASQFFGSGRWTSGNIVPQHPGANLQGSEQYGQEMGIRRSIRLGCKACYAVLPIYNDPKYPGRPSAVWTFLWVDDAQTPQVQEFVNGPRPVG